MFAKQIHMPGILKCIIYLPVGVSIPHLDLGNTHGFFGVSIGLG